MPRRPGLIAAVGAALALLTPACISGPGGKVVDILSVAKTSASRKVTADGTLQAARKVPVAPQVSGEVSIVAVKDGQQVTAGQELFALDSAPYREQLDALESGDSGGGGGGGGGSSEVEVPDLEAAFTTLGNLLGVEQTIIAKQIASYGYLPVDRASDLCLAAAQTTPTVIGDCRAILDLQQQSADLNLQFQEYTTQVTTAFQGDMINAQSNFAFASALGGLGGGGGTNPQVESQKSQLQRQIDNTRIDAPIAGTVVFVVASGGGASALGGGLSPGLTGASASSPGEVRPGSLVNTGQTVMTIYDMSGVHVEAMVDEADIPMVQVGQTVTVTLDAYPDKDIAGKVSDVAVNPSVKDSGGVAYAVDIEIPATDVPNWKPGMTATVDISVEQSTSGIELPSSAVITRGGKDYVFRVEGDKAVRTEVAKRTGSEGFVIITKGIAPGDKVVTSGASDLEDGEAVKSETGSE